MPISDPVRIVTLAASLALLSAPALSGQEAGEVGAPAADPADVESIDAIVTAAYDVISGPAGPRDWDRLRSLFAPGATLVPTAPGPQGKTSPRVLTVEDFIRVAGASFSQNPFYEVETGRTSERFGNVASVMSGYASRRDPADEEPFQRGVNAFTLLHDGERWYVLSIAWDIDRPGNPIPDTYR